MSDEGFFGLLLSVMYQGLEELATNKSGQLKTVEDYQKYAATIFGIAKEQVDKMPKEAK